MRRGVVLAVAALAGWVGVVGGAVTAPASATSCVQRTTAERLGDSDAVFVGTPTTSAADQDTVVVAVTDVYKGEVPPTTPVVAEPDMGSPQVFDDARQYVFFTTLRDGSLVSSVCSGTAPVDDTVLAELEAASSDRSAYRPAPTEPTPSREAPSPVQGTDAADPPSTVSGTDGTAEADDVGSVSPWAMGAVIAALVALVVVVPGYLRRRARKDSVSTTP